MARSALAAYGQAMRRAFPLALLIAVSAAALAQTGAAPLPDWSSADLSWRHGGADDFAASRAICAGVIDAEPPAADYPTPAEAEALRGCNSAHLYFGVGTARNRVAARQCALLEREAYRTAYASEGIEPYPLLDGSGMLAAIYANGQGAARDLDVAIHMACEMGGAPAEMHGRITRLAEVRAHGWRGRAFHPCDDITSGRAGGWCTQLSAAIRAEARSAALAQAVSPWPAPQRHAFAEALRAFTAYSEVANRMNCFGGTLASACQIEGSEQMAARFSARLLAFAESRPLPAPDQAEEGEALEAGDPARAAVMTHAEWQAFAAQLYGDDQAAYEAHRTEAIAARRRFEPALIAFARLARPDLTAHQVRVLFRDL